MEFVGKGIKLDLWDLEDVSKSIGCEVEVLEAVRDVESSGGGFLVDNRPKILFEAHVFGRLTDHEFDNGYPNISSKEWNRELYGAGGSHQYDRLEIAIGLDRNSGLKSCSWGMFQILGLNFKSCGYLGVEDFVKDMCESERKQLEIFQKFCEKNNLNKYLINKDWTSFALRYNGSGQSQNQYDVKLESAYWRHKGEDHSRIPGKTSSPSLIGLGILHKGSRGDDVKKLQRILNLKIDGDFGPKTEAAVKKFQNLHYLISDGIVGPRTWKELNNE